MTVTQEQPFDLAALQADVQKRIGELTEHRGRLSLDALTDADVRLELESVESELAAAETELRRITEAKGERGRRLLEAEAEAERARRAAAMANVARLDRELETDLGLALDNALAELFRLTGAMDRNRQAAARFSAEAGRPVSANWWRAVKLRLECAWYFHASASGAPAALLELEGARPSPRHFRRFTESGAEGAAVPVEGK